MGRATVIGGDKGLYSAKMKYHPMNVAAMQSAIDAELAKIAEDITANEDRITEAEDELSGIETEVNEKIDLYNAAVEEAMANNPEESTHPMTWSPDQWKSFNVAGSLYVGAMTPEEWEKVLNDGWLGDHISFTPTKIEYKKISPEFRELKEKLAAAKLPDINKVLDAFNAIVAAQSEYGVWNNRKTSYQKTIDLLKFRQEALLKKKNSLTAATQDGNYVDAWCADLTTSLTGEVDTLEIMGAPTQILIQPGGVSSLKDENDTAGKLANIMGMSSAGAGLAWALLPGWQKWRPTYRVGTIHSIDYDADIASVNLDTSESIAQNLNVNQGDNLVGIAVDYMECNAGAFVEGDRVVVEFPGQEWDQGPKVIGFETNPKPCGGDIYVCGGDDNLGPARLTRINSTGEIVWTKTYAFDGFFYSVAVVGTSVFACGRKNWNYTVETDRGFFIKVSAATGDEELRIIDLWPAYQVTKAGTGIACGTSYTEIFTGIGTYKRNVYAKASKYNVFGELEWEKSWDHIGPWESSLGAANAVDLYGVSVMATDSSGHIYCGGVDGLYSTAFRKLAQDTGETLWTYDYDSREAVWYLNHITMALNGFVYVRTPGGNLYQFATDIPHKYPLAVDPLTNHFIAIGDNGEATIGHPTLSVPINHVDLGGNIVWTVNVGHSVYDVGISG